MPPSPRIPPLRHLGIYAYRRDFLENYVRWEPTPLEQTESLEQLRALENGARIRVILTDHVSVGVDTPEQAAQVEQILLNYIRNHNHEIHLRHRWCCLLSRQRTGGGIHRYSAGTLRSPRSPFKNSTPT